MATTFDPSAVLGQLTEGYVKLPFVQKVLFPLLIIGAVSGIVFVSKWANQPDYTVLFSDLGPVDSAAVITRLKEQRIKYEVRGDGDTIAVSPPEMVHELRISLAGEGIPKGGVVGFEIFETASLGSTSFQEKIKFMRALQGELERTITSLEAIQTARVHISQPERSVFANRASEPTASVMLKLRPGGELDKKQIKGIANLVSASIEGLKLENVKIIDVFGNLLTPSAEEEEGLSAEATRLQYQREVEKSYTYRIEQMLEKVLGPGKAIARVSAEMDFTLNEREEESFDPGGQVIRSERSIEEGAGSSARGGVPGVVSNLANDPSLLAPAGSSDNSSRKEALKNYEVSRAVTKTSSPRGKLVRLSTAVLVDGAYALAEGAPADAPKSFQPLEPEMLAQIENVVKTAVGFDVSRGDTVTVENVSFHIPEDKFGEELKAKETQDMIFNIMFRAGPILFLLLFFLLIVRPLVRFLVTPTEAEVDLARLLPTGMKELEAELESERSRAEVPAFEPAVDLAQLEELIAENSAIVKQNPQQAALLIRYWLNDGRL